MPVIVMTLRMLLAFSEQQPFVFVVCCAFIIFA
jgi:hypothetical protein